MSLKRLIFIFIIIAVLLTPYIISGENTNDSLIEENHIMRSEIIRLKLLLSKEKAERIPVLLYHHILPKEDIIKYNWTNNGAVISLEDFEEQMNYLHRNNYHTATMKELEMFIDGELQLPKKTVVLTFDDGYLSNKIYAYPIMKEYNQKGTIFVGEHYKSEPKEFSPSGLQFISDKDEIFDVFDIQSHTMYMHNMVGDKSLLEISSYDEIKKDLSLSKEMLNCDYIAYPYGKYNKITLEVLKELDYKLGFTINYGYVTIKSKKYELPRIIIFPGTSLKKFIKTIS